MLKYVIKTCCCLYTSSQPYRSNFQYGCFFIYPAIKRRKQRYIPLQQNMKNKDINIKIITKSLIFYQYEFFKHKIFSI